jgi:arylsulfatase
MMDGRISYTYNWVGLENYTVTSTQRVPPGKHTIKFEFTYDGGRGGGGTGVLSIDGQKAGEGRIAKTNSNTFGIDESADVGVDENTPVVPSYKGKDRFTGTIGSITIETMPAKQ